MNKKYFLTLFLTLTLTACMGDSAGGSDTGIHFKGIISLLVLCVASLGAFVFFWWIYPKTLGAWESFTKSAAQKFAQRLGSSIGAAILSGMIVMTLLTPDEPEDNAQNTEAENAQIEHYATSDEPMLKNVEATSPKSHNKISQRSNVTIQKTIPVSFLGSWGPNEYVSINIHPDKIEGYEGDWFPDKIEVTGDGKTINLLGIDHIEGEVFKRKQTLKISDDGSTLTIEGKGYSTQYNRTEPGPPKGG